MSTKLSPGILSELDIKAIIGLGNPGRPYYYQRHSIGFRVLDLLAERHHLTWQTKGEAEQTELITENGKVLLIKPQTFMNDSGRIIPPLLKRGIAAKNILVIHDELELPFAKIRPRVGGSHRGHNGLRSIAERCGLDFARLRLGIGRPDDREEVGTYVLSPFSEPQEEVEGLIEHSVELIEQALGLKIGLISV